MCGIAGYIPVSTRPDAGRLLRILEALRHRGPDHQGVHETQSAALGAVRLSIIDLAGGDQPMVAEDGTAIAFNGEIYNHAELRGELEARGHRFRSRCDTEVVLRAFLEWDTACFARLRGMFAAALWREDGRRLVLARDRLGIKPLYYLTRGPAFYFGSELKAILLHPEIERRLDPEALGYYLSLNYIPGPHTMVEGIVKLPPGHWLEWRDGRIASEAYWRLRLAPQAHLRIEDAERQLDALLDEAVREHLLSDVPLGVWASGGLDSSTILHYAAKHYPGRLKTFSVSFRGRKFDESPYFRQVAEIYGTGHEEFDLNPSEDLSGAIERMAYYSDEPSADAGALPVWFLSQMCRRRVTVALSGEGADELFGGYYTYLADRYARWLRLTPAALRRLGLWCARALPVSGEKIGFDYKVKRFLAGSLLPPVEAHFYWNGACSREEKLALTGIGGPALARLADALPEGLRRGSGLNAFLWLDQLNYLPDDILYKCDRMSMAHSLEVRPPFLDHRIVEFAASLPEAMKIRGSTLKFLLRRLMRGKLPDAVLTRPKEGFDIPAHDWFRGPLKPLLLDTLTESAARATGLFRWPALDAMLRAHFDRRANLGYQLWGLLVLFLWMKQWKIDCQPARTQPACATTN